LKPKFGKIPYWLPVRQPITPNDSPSGGQSLVVDCGQAFATAPPWRLVGPVSSGDDPIQTFYRTTQLQTLQVVEANIRLDPFQPLVLTSGIIGLANYMLKRYGEAVRFFREWGRASHRWDAQGGAAGGLSLSGGILASALYDSFWPGAPTTAVQHSAAIKRSADMPLVSSDRRG
jgi:hypothetical protein